MRPKTMATLAGLAVASIYAATPTIYSDSSATSIGVEQASQAAQKNVPTVYGCFQAAGVEPIMAFNKTDTFATIGACAQNTCAAGGFAVGGTTGGYDCWCGNKYPPNSYMANDTSCNIGCGGFNTQACGGNGFFTVYNTGKTLSVQTASDEEVQAIASSSSSKIATVAAATAAAVVTISGNVVYVTPTFPAEHASAIPDSSSKSGANTAGIVGGVVVAVVVLGAAAGGFFFWFRRRRNAEIEEEHRRNAVINNFVGKPPGSSGSMTDARLDPVMVHRRMSDGSIADNQDYSRRILRVTNA